MLSLATALLCCSRYFLCPVTHSLDPLWISAVAVLDSSRVSWPHPTSRAVRFSWLFCLRTVFEVPEALLVHFLGRTEQHGVNDSSGKPQPVENRINASASCPSEEILRCILCGLSRIRPQIHWASVAHSGYQHPLFPTSVSYFPYFITAASCEYFQSKFFAPKSLFQWVFVFFIAWGVVWEMENPNKIHAYLLVALCQRPHIMSHNVNKSCYWIN